jgi:hypothetical protein
MLVLWGHAYRFAFGYDGANSLDFVELSDVLRQYKVNILGFDTCGLSTIESAYQLRDCADYMVASEINIPLLGWPYDRILRALRDKPDMDPQALGYTIVKKYVQSFPGGTVALSMLNLGNAEAMIRPMRNLGASLALAAGTDAVQRERLLRLFRNARIPTSTHDPLVDLRKLCGELRAPANGLDRAVQLAASQLDTALDDGNGLVAYHSGRGDGAEDLGGVSAFAPHVGRRRDSILQVYDRLDFSQVQPGQEASPTLWPEVVRFLALAN